MTDAGAVAERILPGGETLIDPHPSRGEHAREDAGDPPVQVLAMDMVRPYDTFTELMGRDIAIAQL